MFFEEEVIVCTFIHSGTHFVSWMVEGEIGWMDECIVGIGV